MRYLKQDGTGFLYGFSEILAQRPDMKLTDEVPEGVKRAKGKPKAEDTPVQADSEIDTGAPDFTKMSRAELTKYAKDNFGMVMSKSASLGAIIDAINEAAAV